VRDLVNSLDYRLTQTLFSVLSFLFQYLQIRVRILQVLRKNKERGRKSKKSVSFSLSLSLFSLSFHNTSQLCLRVSNVLAKLLTSLITHNKSNWISPGVLRRKKKNLIKKRKVRLAPSVLSVEMGS